MEEVPRVRALAGRGLEGDRFLDFKPDYKGQVTLFSEEVWKACSEVFLKPDLPPWAFRRNLLTRGDADLTRWIGRRFRIQEVVLEGTGECAPCEWMEQAVAPGAWEWLKGRGGLRCRILTDGLLRTDHPA
jgi:MOSC domain-containing protein YiiM